MPPRGRSGSPPAGLVLALGLLVPGAGHLATRRRGKAALFFITITGTFAFGWGVTRGECVSVERHPVAFVGQLGAVGPTAAALLAGRGREERLWVEALVARGALSESMAARVPTREGSEAVWTVVRDRLGVPAGEVQAAYWESARRAPARGDIGLLYTMVAGLLNVLVAFDAADGSSRTRGPVDAPAGD